MANFNMDDLINLKSSTDEQRGVGVPLDQEDEVEDEEIVEKEEKPVKKVAEKEEKASDGNEDDAESEEEEEEKPKGKGGKGVPFKRFQEVLKKNHTYETELETMRLELAEVRAAKEAKAAEKEAEDDAYDFDSKEEEYAKLVSEAVDYSKAASLRAEINAKLSEKVVKHSQKEMRIELDKLRQEQEFAVLRAEATSVSTEIWREYPELDHNNAKEMNVEAINELKALRDYNRSRGMSIGEALRAATRVVAIQYDLQGTKQKPSTKKVDSDREARANRDAQDASERTPPSTSKVGIGAKTEAKVDKEHSLKQWEKMSRSERDEAMGKKSQD